jgi:hypothetical protein
VLQNIVNEKMGENKEYSAMPADGFLQHNNGGAPEVNLAARGPTCLLGLDWGRPADILSLD